MLSQMIYRANARHSLMSQNNQLTQAAMRMISSKATLQKETDKVKLRGKFLQGRKPDLPTMIWLADLVEPVENFTKFFTRPDNKIADVRNVWLLNYRNFGDSDHHESFDLDDMSNDIVRFMDDNKITMATIGGHGFGAKVATVTANNNLNRFTGIISLEGGPLNHKYYEAYQELESYVEIAQNLNVSQLSPTEAVWKLSEQINDPMWRHIFIQNIIPDKGNLGWQCNMEGLYKNMKKFNPDVANWSESYGLWPGQALFLFAAHSRWVFLNTNTLPIYNVFPRLQGKFPDFINTHGEDYEGPLNHWIHEYPEDQVWYLSQKMYRWLRWHDGAHVLLADKSEAGWHYIPDRGFDTITNTVHGEYIPEHVHHDYLHTDLYDKSRKNRGVEGASHGQFLAPGKFSPGAEPPQK